MRFVRICRVNNERSSSCHCVFSPIRYIDPTSVSHSRACMCVWVCRLDFGRHGALMNGPGVVCTRGESRRKFSNLCLRPPVRPVPTLVAPRLVSLRDSLPIHEPCDIRLRGKWTYKYISYVNSDEIYSTGTAPCHSPHNFLHAHFIYPRSSYLAHSHSQVYYLFI